MDFKGREYHTNGVKEGGGIMEQKVIGSIGEGTLKSFEKDIWKPSKKILKYVHILHV